MSTPFDRVLPVAESLLSCLEEQLSIYDAGACRTFIAPGNAPAWDFCCHCETNAEGMAWVQIASVFPSDDFPSPQTGAMRCKPSGYGVVMNVGVLRCASALDDNGRPPSSDRLTAEAAKVMRDRAIVNEAITCCFLADADPGTYVIGEWTPLGPDGGCVGGSTQLTVVIAACRCPEHGDDYEAS